jgi:purine nucleosidase
LRTFVIDTDTASDDAVALAMALRAPEVRVAAIMVVAGNVPLDQAVQNALYTREVVGGDAPIYAGRGRPRAGELHTAQFVHGEDGMGDIGLPLSGREPDEGDAVEKLVELVRAAPGEVELVTLGPLTNIAEAFERAPDLAGALRRLVMMGGTSDAVGNVAPAAEFNIWADPEAARIVFRSGAPIEMVGWDISRKYAVFTPEQSAALAALGPVAGSAPRSRRRSTSSRGRPRTSRATTCRIRSRWRSPSTHRSRRRSAASTSTSRSRAS